MHIKKVLFHRPMKIDYYILEEVMSSFLGSCLFIVFILLMFQALRIAEFLIIHGVSAPILAKMSGLLTISFLPTAVPLAFLMGILLSFSRLSADSEIVAMKANGIGLFRLSYSLFVAAILLSLFSVVLNNTWVPWSVSYYKTIEDKVRNTKAASVIREGAFTSGFFDLLVFADKVDTKKNRLHRVFIFDEREPKNPLTYVAREAEIVPVKTGTDLGAAILMRLFHGSMHHNSLEYHTYEKIDFDNYQLYLKIAEGTDQVVSRPQMILQDKLISLIQSFPTESSENREYRGEYWRRYAMAFSPLVFVILGVAFGTFRYRAARSSTILIGLLIVLFYWTIQLWGSSCIAKGTVSPFVGMQLPNFLLLIVGILGFRKSAW